MPQTNNIITPKERLMIAAQQMAATAPKGGYISISDFQRKEIATDALWLTDALIAESGCIVEGQPEPATYSMD